MAAGIALVTMTVHIMPWIWITWLILHLIANSSALVDETFIALVDSFCNDIMFSSNMRADVIMLFLTLVSDMANNIRIIGETLVDILKFVEIGQLLLQHFCILLY